MPITLGCPSCGKRFRARDESAGKRVKCPFCGAVVAVPTADEAAFAAAPTSIMPPTPPPTGSERATSSGEPGPAAVPPSSRLGSTTAASVASADDWGAAAPPPATYPLAPPPPPVPVVTAPPPVSIDTSRSWSIPGKKAVGNIRAGGSGDGTMDETAAPGWRRVKGGLGWVLFALFWLALLGTVGLGKLVYIRTGGELPSGPGGDWVSIPGYLNTNEPKTFNLSKQELLDVALYGIPVILGGLSLGFGRLTCAGVPRVSGAKGLFALSGLFTFLALAAAVATAGCDKLQLTDEYHYALTALLITGIAAEFWFLTGLTACGGTLRQPRVARAIGFLGFLTTVIATAVTIGWPLYAREWRPRPLTEDWRLYEQAALTVTWLVVVIVYGRAVGGVRRGVVELLDSVRR